MSTKLIQKGVVAAALIAVGAFSAQAADMPLKAPYAAPGYNWSGFYIGGVAGGAWSYNDFSDPDPATAPDGRPLPLTQTVNANSWLAGVEAGWNYQIGRLVVGSEWDFTWTDISGTDTTGYGFGTTLPHSHNDALTADTDWIGTGTGRVGYAMGQWMLYSKAGVAVVKTNYTQRLYEVAAGFTDFTGSGSNTRVGWTVGTGIEYAFMGNWSAKLEYDYIGLGNNAASINGSAYPGHFYGFPTGFTVNNNQNISEIKFGLNYRLQNLP